MLIQNGTSMLSARDQVASVIRQKVLNGEYKSGEQITERAISEALEISTTPVKEAFRILATEGVLVVRPRKGTFIADLSTQNIVHVNFIRSSLEGSAAYFAAKNITSEQIDEMFYSLEMCYKFLEKSQLDLIPQYASQFHETIRIASNCSYLRTLLNNFRSVDFSIRELTSEKSIEAHFRDYFEHKDIANAISHRNASLSEQLIIQHIRRVILDTFPENI